MNIVDAHHHLWHYSPAEYGWISQDMSILRRDFLPRDLEQTLSKSGVTGSIAVQARQTTQETHWLLEASGQHPLIRGVVGWVPLTSPALADDLERFAANPKFRAVRHVIQAEPDDNYILRDDFNRGIALLSKYNLRYDILIFERHLPQAIEFVDRHPDQIFVLDHIAKPKIKSGDIEPWHRNIVELAQRPNVYCKLSGMVSEADWKTWTADSLRPYFESALAAFTPNRLMYGSDWPVCLVAASYQRWLDTVRTWIAPLSAAEQERIMSGTASEAYALAEETDP